MVLITNRWRLSPIRIACVAVAVYWIWAGLLILQNPGLQYDEALLVSGAVHMLRSPLELSLPHDPKTWMCIQGRCFPLMTVRYIGPMKEYLCLPLFALFGAQTVIIRLVAVLLASIGIFGITKLLADHLGVIAAACTGFALAISPTYTDLTVFDNNAVAIMMAALGLLCLALSAYLRQPSVRAALWVGGAMGFGIWARANSVWFLAAFCGAAILVLNRRMLAIPRSHWLAWIGGGVLGGLPFLVYQVRSHGGTWQGLEIFANHQPLADQVYYRFILFSEMLLSDREHRAMWNGPPLPDWQRWIFPTILLAACAVPWLVRKRDEVATLWARFASVTVVLLMVVLFTSRLALSEHHLVAVLPIAIAATVLSASLVIGWSRWARVLIFSVALLYAVCAFDWQIAAVRGLARTGGTGPWSDAIYDLAENLEQRYSGRLIHILDWGLQDNLYVLSQGRLSTVEIYNPENGNRTLQGRSWAEEVRDGGVFLSNAPANVQFPEPTAQFLKALNELQPAVHRYATMQRTDIGFAQIFQIPTLSRLSMSDARAAKSLTGFYKPEESRWRWTERRFSMLLDAPEPHQNQALLKVRFYVPEASIAKFREVTLNTTLNGHALPSATYRKSGPQQYAPAFPAEWLAGGENKFEFVLDRALPPSPSDRRELGIIVVNASLEMK